MGQTRSSSYRAIWNSITLVTATATSSTLNTVVPLHGSNEPNYAPLKPIEQAKETALRTNPELDKWAKSVRDKHWMRHSEQFDQKALVASKNEFFYRGFFRLRKATYGNHWRPLDPKPVHVSINVFRFWIDMIVKYWVASNADFDVLGSSDDDKQVAAAKKGERIVDFYGKKFHTTIDRIVESKRGQFEGNLARYVYYDPNAPARARRPVVENQEISLADPAAHCADCGMGGTQAEFSGLNAETGQAETACPYCASANVVPVEAAGVSMPAVVDYEEVNAGDLRLQNPSIYNLRYDVALGLELSPWLIWEEWYDKDVIDALWPNLKKSAEEPTDTQLKAKDALAGLNERIGTATAQNEDRVKLTRMWLKPSKYPGYRVDQETRTLSGVIPKGTYLSQLCPKGVYIAMVGDVVVDIRPEDKDDHWCGTGYHILPNSGLHDGAEDMCNPQVNLNTVKGLINMWLRHNATPAGLWNPLLMDGRDWSGNPGEFAPIKHENIGMVEGLDITKAVYYPPGQQMPAGVFQYGEMSSNDLQLTAHVTEFSGGLPGVDNDTATGAEIARSLAQQIHTTQLAQRAYLDAKTSKLVLKLFRKFCWDERWVYLKGKEGDFEGEYLSAADVDYEFDVEPVIDSWLPRTKMEKQQNLVKAIEVIQQAGGFAMAPPELIAEIADTFSVDFGDERFHQAVRMARRRVDQMAEALPGLLPLLQFLPPTELVADPLTGEMVEAPLDPMAELGAALVLSLQPRFNPRELGHELAINFLRAWYLTDEGIKAHPGLIAGVNALMDQYMEALAMESQTTARIAMAAQPPMMSPMEADGPQKTNQERRNESAKANLGSGTPKPNKQPQPKPKAQARGN